LTSLSVKGILQTDLKIQKSKKGKEVIKTEERPEEERPEERPEKPKREVLRKVGALAFLTAGTVLLYLLFSLLYQYLALPMGLFWITNAFIPDAPPQVQMIPTTNGTMFYTTPNSFDLPSLKTLCGGLVIGFMFIVGGYLIGRIFKTAVDLWRKRTEELVKEIRALKKALK